MSLSKRRKRLPVQMILTSTVIILGLMPVLIWVLFFTNVLDGEIKKTIDLSPVDVGVTDTSIRIGSVSALDGPSKYLGINYVEYGMNVAIKEFNDNGGAFGRKIEFISRSDGYDPQRTIEETRRLIEEDKVFALAGYVGTPTGVAALPIINTHKIPLVGVFSGAGAFRNPVQPYVFNARASYDEEAEAAAKYFIDILGLTRIGILYQDDAFGNEAVSSIEKALKIRGIAARSIVSYPRNTTEIDNAVEAFKQEDLEVIMAAAIYAPFARFIDEMSKYNPDIYFHALTGVVPDQFAIEFDHNNVKIDTFQNRDSRIFVTQVVPPPYYHDVFDGLFRYHETLHYYYPDAPVTFGGLEGYIAGRVLLMGILDAGKDITREKFMSALERLSYKDISIGSTITLTKDNHQGLNKVFLTRLVDGEYMIVPMVNLYAEHKKAEANK